MPVTTRHSSLPREASMTLKPCLDCGELTPDSRCPEHDTRPPRASRAAGYDTAHDKMSRRARAIQPWCTTCGTEDDLQLDHSPETWKRKAEGKPLRLSDYRGVYCGDCNRKNGAAR